MSVQYSKNIKELFKEIDVSDNDYEKAVNRYESISNFISNSKLSMYKPKLFVQGSFKLGTAIKPLTEDGAYDVDMVLVLQELNKKQISQKDLKKITGKVITTYTEKNQMIAKPHDGKRCWTIEYVDGHNFHVDILPTLPNISSNLNQLAFTDKNSSEYSVITDNWSISNPQDYYLWFVNLSKHSEYKKRFAIQNKIDIEKVPNYKVKTPLQRIIQVLKRHAELMFDENIEYKPSSIIITTLAAKAYRHYNETTITFHQLMKIIINNLEGELDYFMGHYCVLNPVDKNEDLSSKWKNPIYFQKFRIWIEQLKFDFSVNSTSIAPIEEFNIMKRSLFHSKIPTRDLQNIIDLLPYHKKMAWKNQIWKKIKIKCFLIVNNKKVREIQSGEILKKNSNICFEAIADCLDLYSVYWQITNTGFEAQKYNQLRGDFYESELIRGLQCRTENTKYTGKHYAEAFIVDSKNNCVGRSLPFVVNVE